METFFKKIFLIFFISISVVLVSCEKDNEPIDRQLAVGTTSFSIDQLVSEVNKDTYLYSKLIQIQQMDTEKGAEELTYLFEQMATKYNIEGNLNNQEITTIFTDTFFSLFRKIKNTSNEETTDYRLPIDPNCFSGRHGCCSLFGEARVRCFEIHCPGVNSSFLCYRKK